MWENSHNKKIVFSSYVWFISSITKIWVFIEMVDMKRKLEMEGCNVFYFMIIINWTLRLKVGWIWHLFIPRWKNKQTNRAASVTTCVSSSSSSKCAPLSERCRLSRRARCCCFRLCTCRLRRANQQRRQLNHLKNKNKSFKPSRILKGQHLPVKSNIFTLFEFLEHTEAQVSTINKCHF